MGTTEPIAPARIAEIATAAAEMITRRGWCQETLFDPETGGVSCRGAYAVVVGIPPLTSHLFSPLYREVRQWREFYAVDSALGDYLSLPEVEGCNCGNHHDNRAVAWEDAPGRTQVEVVAALRGLADAATKLSVHDATFNEADVDWDAFVAGLRAE